jgi:hypothetical protein
METSNDLKIFLQEWIDKSHFDLAMVEKHWSTQQGVLGIFTAPHEWLVGHQAILDHYRQALPTRDEYRVVVDHLDAYCEGSVGWVAARPVFILGKGGKVTTRFTAVLHREDGEWKFVQYHLSVAVSDEESFRMAQPE